MADEEARSVKNEERLHAVIAEYMKRRDAGQPVNQQSLIQAYPELADGLRSYFQGEAIFDDPAFAATKLGKLPSAALSGRETLLPGIAAADTASEFTARTFGRYLLLRPLGEGAMGTVYLAQDTTLDRRVALKMPRRAAAERAKGSSEFLQRFTREARAAAGLKHPNICSVYDAGEIDGTAYITMDFIDGVPLSRLVGTKFLQTVPDILKIIRVIADAVSHAHSKGIIHRDLKPGNILIDGQMNPYVTDFGLARRESSSDGSRITQEGLLIGTPAYMAPEQVRGEQAKVGATSDIYSLGVIFFELLTARLPFEGSVPDMLAKVLRDPSPIPSRLRTDLSEDVDDVVLKMLQKEIDRRYQSMQQVIAAIDQLSLKLQKTSEAPAISAVKDTEARARSPFEIQKAHIELMLKKGQYVGAIRDLEAMANEQAPGAKAIAEWARKTLPEAKKEARAMSPSGLAAMLKTAEQLFEKSDYLGCIQLLDDVPSLKRTEAMETLLQKAQQREAAAEQLMEQIRDKERRENPEGLDVLVRKYLKLKPGNAYAKKLWQALQTYSSTPASRRTYRFEKGRLQAMPEISFFRRYALLAVLLAALSFLSTYAYVIVYLKSGSQTLAIQVDDEWLKEQGGQLTLVVDGDEHTISTSPANGEPLTIVVKVGERQFFVKHGDTVVHNPRTFTIERNGKSVLQITPTEMELRTTPMIAGGGTGGNSANAPIGETMSQTQPSALQNTLEPWTDLFDGKDTSRWQTLGQFQVESGLLVARNGRTMAVSKDQYGDFELEVEWRLTGTTPNGGIYYRELPITQTEGNEYQIVDPAHRFANTALFRSGALYGVIPTKEGIEKPLGEWNTARVICKGSVVEHWLNGERLFSYDAGSEAWKKAIAESPLKGNKERIGRARKGHLLLQAQTGEVAFRRIRIRERNGSEVSGKSPDAAVTDLDKIATGVWQSIDCSGYAADLPDHVKVIPDGISLREKILPFNQITGKDVILRADVRKVSGRNSGLQVRLTTGADGWKNYACWYNGADANGGDFFGVGKSAGGYVDLGNGHSGTAASADGFVDMALAAIGETITLFVDGKRILECQDNSYTEGQFALSSPRTLSEFRNIRYQILDAASSPTLRNSSDTGTPKTLQAPFNADALASQRRLWASKINEPEEINEAGIQFKLIPPGEFTMGSPDSEPNREPSEGPQHRVRITQPFFMGVTEITQKQWVDVMGTCPWQGMTNVKEGDRFPATFVDWNSAKAFCRKISVLTGNSYRLPTEAEWEYACRAGTESRWYSGDDTTELNSYGWFESNTLSVNEIYAHEVATKTANRFGLFDMHGNLFEWCEDYYDPVAYARRKGTTEDPVTLSDVEGLDRHVTRGGGFVWGHDSGRSASRTVIQSIFRSERDGFRVVRLCKTSPEVVRAEEPANAPFPALKARAYQQAWADHLKLPVNFTNSIGMNFRLIPPGSFTIGSTQVEVDAARPHLHIGQDPTRPERISSELPQQRITLTRPFYLGVTEITQAQYNAVVGTNPSAAPKDAVTGEDRVNAPVEMVTWVDTGEFCSRLSLHEGLESAYRVTPDLITQTGFGGYRLPTEAEWEFACRAGTTTLFWCGDDDESLANVAWFGINNEGNVPKPVATKLANPFGLYDMHGNVWEWIHDVWRSDTYHGLVGPAAVDPRIDTGPEDRRVMRGGDHFMSSSELRSACRDGYSLGSHWTDVGFRVAISVEAVRFRLSANP